jgi:hypothetical protein
MSNAKYKQFFEEMVSQHQELFDKFATLQDKFSKDREGVIEEFNNVGKEVLAILRDGERRLCRQTESGGYSKYSGSLADKFWQLVREKYPKIDLVGMK